MTNIRNIGLKLEVKLEWIQLPFNEIIRHLIFIRRVVGCNTYICLSAGPVECQPYCFATNYTMHLWRWHQCGWYWSLYVGLYRFPLTTLAAYPAALLLLGRKWVQWMNWRYLIALRSLYTNSYLDFFQLLIALYDWIKRSIDLFEL